MTGLSVPGMSDAELVTLLRSLSEYPMRLWFTVALGVMGLLLLVIMTLSLITTTHVLSERSRRRMAVNRDLSFSYTKKPTYIDEEEYEDSKAKLLG